MTWTRSWWSHPSSCPSPLSPPPTPSTSSRWPGPGLGDLIPLPAPPPCSPPPPSPLLPLVPALCRSQFVSPSVWWSLHLPFCNYSCLSLCLIKKKSGFDQPDGSVNQHVWGMYTFFSHLGIWVYIWKEFWNHVFLWQSLIVHVWLVGC